MTESNNVVSFSDWKGKKDPEKKKELEKAREVVSSVKVDQLEEQSLASAEIPEDNYKNFVTAPDNVNKIEFIMTELMKTVASQYPDIITCRFGDVLFLKESVISLIMRAWLGEDHPFQHMADGLEKAFNKVGNNDSTK